MATQYVYDFSEGGGLGRELLGGKGVGLAEMTAIGLPVPAGFTVTTEACREYMRLGGSVPEGLSGQVADAVARLETSGPRSSTGSPSSRSHWAVGSATWRRRCCSRCARGPPSRCPG